MSNKVQMIICVGDQEFSLGECHPAQARVLVRNEAASWRDGKLLIIARPAWISIVESNNAWRGPLDRDEVSPAEMDRRQAWFKDFMLQGITAVLSARDLTPRHLPVGRIHKRGDPRPEEYVDEDFPEEEVAGWFTNTEAEIEAAALETLAASWEEQEDPSRSLESIRKSLPTLYGRASSRIYRGPGLKSKLKRSKLEHQDPQEPVVLSMTMK